MQMAISGTDTFHLLGNIIRMFSPSTANGGAFSMAEFITRPSCGSPPNRHPGENESFYVLTGQDEFIVNGEPQVLGPGGFIRVPDGAPHQFTNCGEADATMLVINRPGQVHDSFFAEAGEPLPSGSKRFPPPSSTPPGMARIRAIAIRCGIEFVPKP